MQIPDIPSEVIKYYENNKHLFEKDLSDDFDALLKASKLKQCLLLKKAINGLKQGSKKWYIKFTKTIIAKGFTQSKADPCLLYKDENVTLIAPASIRWADRPM